MSEIDVAGLGQLYGARDGVVGRVTAARAEFAVANAIGLGRRHGDHANRVRRVAEC